MSATPQDKRPTIDAVGATPTDSLPAETIELTTARSHSVASVPPPSQVTGFEPTINNLPTGMLATMDSVVEPKEKRRSAAVLNTSVGDYEIERELGRGGKRECLGSE